MTPPEEKTQGEVDHLFRRQAGQMVSTLTRRLGWEHLQLAEDAVQDAFVAALRRWSWGEMPENPEGWLFAVARNRAIDRLRHLGMLHSRLEELGRDLTWVEEDPEMAGVGFADELEEDRLRMVFACCHPTLSRDDQVILTLKTVGGLSVPEIARAFLARAPAIAQRLVRAKRRLRDSGIRLEIPGPDELAGRREAALEVAYLLFSEGHSTTAGDDSIRPELCDEAIRIAELIADHPVAASPGADALAALLLLQRARMPARVDADGEMVLLPDQDRSRWDGERIGRGLWRLRRSARGTVLTSYHLQAEIASCHAVSPTWEATDWPRILGCYDRLWVLEPSPVVALNRLVARAEVDGAESALTELERLESASALDRHLPSWITRAQLLIRCGRPEEAGIALGNALELDPSAPVRRWIERIRPVTDDSGRGVSALR